MAPLLDSFEYLGKHISVEWYEVGDIKSLPTVLWQQVYAVANLDGKVPVVIYKDGNRNLPGGKTEPNETVEDTITRELKEELNCKVIKWHPIGYQRLSDEGGEIGYQLRVYAEIERIGEFSSDPGGGVVGYECIVVKNLNEAIHYGKVGERIAEIVAPYF